MNKVIIKGRLTKDPDVRYTEGNEPKAVAKFTLAVDRKFKKDEADFISCVAFGRQGEFAEKFLRKGTAILIEGRWQTGSYENKDGNRVYTNDCVVEGYDFCEKKATDGSEGQPTENPTDEWMNVPDGIDEELPFN
jgi:single-strand DNA-binding protein